jgi:branched-chain amino acid transport system substrate-binding protein
MSTHDHRAREPLKIGAIFMFRGPIAELGIDSFDGAEAARDLVNAEGGVHGRAVEWVRGDGYTPDEAAREAERMIRQEGVKVILGCYGSNHSIGLSKVCERLGAVLWVQTAWTADLFAHRPRYTFRTNTFATPVETCAVDYVLDVLAPRLGKERSALATAVIHESSAYGISCAAETVKVLDARGVPIVLRGAYEGAYDGTGVDFAAVVGKMKAAKPDVLFASSFIRDAVGILRAMRAQRYRPPAIMTSSAGFGLYTLNAAGAATEGVLSANAPALIHPGALNDTGGALQREYVTRLKARTGREPSGFNAMSFVAAYSLLANVLTKVENAGDVDEIRSAAVALDIPLGTYPNGDGLKLDAGGQNERCPPCIDQWQSGALRTVWPEDKAIATVKDIPLPYLADERTRGSR